MKLRARSRTRLVGLVAASAALITMGQTTMHSAGADPVSSSAYAVVGSDTVQDIFNAFSGVPYPPSAPKYYQPLVSSTASGSKGIVSFDAVTPGTGAANECIISKYGGTAFARPNGSGQGVSALSRVGDAGNWSKGTACNSANSGNVSGQIDAARSSAGPASFPSGTTLTFIPFARDGISYAYFDHGTNEAASLTSAQLQQLYGTNNVPTGGTITLANGHVVHACMVQSGSGTGKFWDKAMGNAGNGTTATQSAVNSGCNANGVNYEENGYNSWAASTYVSGLASTDDAIIPFSSASWISQANGTGIDRSSNGRTSGVDQIGHIDGVAPINGTSPNETPNATYFNSTTYGRDMFVVLLSSKIGTFGDAGLKSLFVGSTSAICSANAQSIDSKFGFAYPPQSAPCGDTSQKSGYNPN